MLGLYENFPPNVHKTLSFSTLLSNKRLQQILIQTLSEINGKTFDLKEFSDPLIPNCTVIFEFGIAEASTFNYLDAEETNKILKIIQKRPFQIMDFYCAIRYYKTQNGKRTPLKFDYYILRLIFDGGLLEARVFHERGLQYVSPTDLVQFIVNKINTKTSRKLLKPLENP
ncbi:MAG: hypothetical protein QXM86_05020 [Candidatus Bathyarchaeia archaeon]